MYLVEYVQKRKTEKFNYCSGFYDKQEAFDFAIKLGHCANVIGVTLSFIDTSYAEILYVENSYDKQEVDKTFNNTTISLNDLCEVSNEK